MNKAIHGAFRRDLDRFVGALTTSQPTTVRAAATRPAWRNFHAHLTHHHEACTPSPDRAPSRSASAATCLPP